MDHEITTKYIRVYGIVQGVGFRPSVSRHALETGITGTVANRGSFVEIYAQGTEDQIRIFLGLTEHDSPERSVILKTDVKELRDAETYTEFNIVESSEESGEIFVSPDIAVCDDCMRELYDRTNRRYLHPFINCTQCGPRLTILEHLPYDRERTSMKKFPMCGKCAEEYRNPSSRRYDAQPVCCNECGPEVYLLGRGERGRDAITKARRVLSGGGIIAVKGIGGFHLACDAASDAAVARLRRLKHRPSKPFAVVMRDEETTERFCMMTARQREILTGHQKPILLLEKRKDAGAARGNDEDEIELSDLVAPDNPKLGVMLPYAPIQLLLFRYDDDIRVSPALVMTSGNVSGSPIASTDEEAEEMLSGIADLILSNNREIRTRCDDSVMDFYHGEPYMVRRSRGYAPLPVLVTENESRKRTVLAIGGELKNTFCIARDGLYYPSSYIGDLADVRSESVLKKTIETMETLLEAKPDLIVCDLHPGYRSSAVAEKLAKEAGVPLVKVQHHYAHILSAMAENDEAGPVIGVSFDGTGYGTDGTIWGGEFLLAERSGFVRKGSICPFLQIGGDASAKDGWRIAVSMLADLYGAECAEKAVELGVCSKDAAKTLKILHDRKAGAVMSTSCGRLFDAVSAILGFCRSSGYEGEAAQKLMFAAERGKSRISGMEIREDSESIFLERPEIFKQDQAETAEGREQYIFRTDRLLKQIAERKLSGEDPEKLAYAFHERLADGIAGTVCAIAEETRVRKTALSGGCFQNTMLLELTEKRLLSKGMTVLRHHMIPPNDGGLALGQAYYGMHVPVRSDE